MARPVSLRIVLALAHPRPSPSTAHLAPIPLLHPLRLYSTHPHRRPTPAEAKAAAQAAAQAQAEATAELLHRGGTTAGSAAREGAAGRDRVGPFPLGVGPNGRSKAWKSWKELGIGGKLIRTTQQTGNLAVILVGGALCVMLTFALTSELFAKNSPSVLYSQAVDLIRASDALDPHLLPPLKYTHSPTSSAPVRGSPPIAHTFIRHPTSGRDHLLITFWVHGRGKDEEEPLHWAKGIWGKAVGWGRQGMVAVGLIEEGSADGSKAAEASPASPSQAAASPAKEEQPGIASRWFGGFSSLRSPASAKGGSTRGLPPPGTYKIGEARAEYVKNASGQFVLLSLIVDIPSSRAAYPGRAVIFQSPEAEKEGLLGKRIR
ncbi:hypothetical protein IAT38_001216 [Cryptococcus sp. DSM 104549]